MKLQVTQPFKFEGHRFTITVSDEPGKKSKAYIWLGNVADDLLARASGERHGRGRIAFDRKLLAAGLEAVGGYLPPGTRYRRTLGCSCGCSPGFALPDDGREFSIEQIKPAEKTAKKKKTAKKTERKAA